MSRFARVLTSLVILALLLAAFPVRPVVAQDDGGPPPPQPYIPRFDAPPFGVRGPHPVGTRELIIEGADGERSIPVTIWYPALNPEQSPEEIIYERVFGNPLVPDLEIAGRALLDADPDLSNGPYPLVVYSHGYWCFSHFAVWLTEHLASQGFVVIAADHDDNWSNAFGENQFENYIVRPQEIIAQIDFAQALSEEEGDFQGMIDAETVGVVGHSYGAETALQVGGARFNANHYIDVWCAEHPPAADDPFSDCTAAPGKLDEMAAMMGLDAPPEGIWPDQGDPRIKAVVALAGGAHYFGPEGMATLQKPTLIVQFENDWSYGEVNKAYDYTALLPEGLWTSAYFERADHQLPANDCATVPALPEAGMGWACADDVWDLGRAHDLLNHFISAYFLAELKGDAAAADALAPENVSFRAVQYTTSEFGSEEPAAESAAAPLAGLRPDAPAYAVRGPHAVGYREFSIENGDQRVDGGIWYPALNADGKPEEITYRIGDGVPGFAGLEGFGRALENAEPNPDLAPYPLVVYSPGLSAWKQINSFLVEHLASHGVVVVSWDPRGEEMGGDFWLGAATRPLDTQAMIDQADVFTAPGGDFEGLIDTERIAIAGHSSGGWTALLGGGAQFNLGWCEANPDRVAANPLSNCPQFTGHAEEIAAMLGLDEVPEGLWPALNDPRVDAVLDLSGDGDIWGAEYEGITSLTLPTMVMFGSNDTSNVPEVTSYPVYEHLGSADKSMVVFENAEHFIFMNACSDLPFMLPDFHAFCSDAVWDMDRAHDLINHFATAFILAELNDDPEAAAALASEAIAFPGVRYETTRSGE